MLVFRVPRDPLRELSCSMMNLDDPDYATSSFEDFIMEDIDYVTWFLQSLV